MMPTRDLLPSLYTQQNDGLLYRALALVLNMTVYVCQIDTLVEKGG
jgi:hypothetical protein